MKTSRFSKKTYKEIAEVLKWCLEEIHKNPPSSVSAEDIVLIISKTFETIFSKDNPNFDPDKFWKAVFGE